MAKELKAVVASGTPYVQLFRESDFQFWNTVTPGFENYVTANIAHYAIAMTKLGTASMRWYADFPSGIAAGRYTAIVKLQAGGSPAESDTDISVGSVDWTGSVLGPIVNSQGYQGVNIAQMNSSSTAAVRQQLAADAIYVGTVTGATSVTSLVDSGLTQSATDFWKGRVVIFTTGSLAGQATDIVGFTPGSDQLTLSRLTSAPNTSDTYIIL